MLLAPRHALSVTPVVAAGRAAGRRHPGHAGRRTPSCPSSTRPRSMSPPRPAMWAGCTALQRGGRRPRRHRRARSCSTPIGTVRLGGFARAQPITDVSQVHTDHAQLLITTALRSVRAAPSPRSAGRRGRSRCRPPLVGPPAGAGGRLRVPSRGRPAGLRSSTCAATTAAGRHRGARAPEAGGSAGERSSGSRVLGSVGTHSSPGSRTSGLDTIADAIASASLPRAAVRPGPGPDPPGGQAGSLRAASPTPVPLDPGDASCMFAICSSTWRCRRRPPGPRPASGSSSGRGPPGARCRPARSTPCRVHRTDHLLLEGSSSSGWAPSGSTVSPRRTSTTGPGPPWPSSSAVRPRGHGRGLVRPPPPPDGFGIWGQLTERLTVLRSPSCGGPAPGLQPAGRAPLLADVWWCSRPSTSGRLSPT